MKIKRADMEWTVTCDMLKQFFTNAGYLDMGVVGVNNAEGSFLWFDATECAYGVNLVFLEENLDGLVTGDMGGTPIKEWSCVSSRELELIEQLQEFLNTPFPDLTVLAVNITNGTFLSYDDEKQYRYFEGNFKLESPPQDNVDTLVSVGFGVAIASYF